MRFASVMDCSQDRSGEVVMFPVVISIGKLGHLRKLLDNL